MKLVLLIN